jgi:hypothetical protein
MFVRDIIYDLGWNSRSILQWIKPTTSPANETINDISASHPIGSQTTSSSEVIPLDMISDTVATEHTPSGRASSTGIEVASTVSSRTFARSVTENGHANLSIRNKKGKSNRIRDRFPTLYAIATRMPWKILPFALGMFILVEALSDLGWTAIFATALARITPNYIAAVFAVTFITILSCQLLNNLPMTILFTRIMQHPNFYQAANVTPKVLKGSIFSLIVGSNLGACFTLVGSLAGIM